MPGQLIIMCNTAVIDSFAVGGESTGAITADISLLESVDRLNELPA